MHTHRIDSFFLADNLRLEIVHEANPYFASEPISLVIRIRHLGSPQEFSTIKAKLQNLQNEIAESLEHNDDASTLNSSTDTISKSKPNDEQSWSMKSLLSSFVSKNDPQDSKLVKEKQQLKEHLSKKLQYHKPIQLITGYVQISGGFQFDTATINTSSFDHLGKKKVKSEASTLIAPIQPEDIGEPIKELDSSSILKYINSNYNLVNNGLISKSENQILGSDSSNLIVNASAFMSPKEYDSYPTIVIPQSLLFSELNLSAGEVKTFHFRSENLPKDLPPSYNNSNIMSINYSIEVGLNKIIGSNIKQELIKVPIYIAPYVSPTGEQYTSTLDCNPIIMSEGSVKELKNNVVNRRISTISVSSAHSAQSNNGPEYTKKVESLKQNFVKLVESNSMDTKLIEELVAIQIKEQFPDLNNSDEDIEMEGDEVEEKAYANKRVSPVRNNISNLYNIDSITSDQPDGDGITKLIPQIKSLQRSYQINRNGQYIANLTLSKPFYTTTDDIEMMLKFDENLSSNFKVTAVTVSLESFEILSSKFDFSTNENRKPKGNTVYETHSISFDECHSIPFKIILPKSPTNQLTGQFKTDVFQLKWMLVFKFVLIPKEDEYVLEQFYEDKKGYLLHAKESLEGEEFICHIPLTLLPSSHAYGGW